MLTAELEQRTSTALGRLPATAVPTLLLLLLIASPGSSLPEAAKLQEERDVTLDGLLRSWAQGLTTSQVFTPTTSVVTGQTATLGDGCRVPHSYRLRPGRHER